MSLTTEYRGYTIRFSENEEVWRCADIRFDHAKLNKVKERIDDLHRKLRKASALPCLIVSNRWSSVEAREGTIIEYIGPKTTRSWSDGEKVVGHQVAVMSTREINERPGREIMQIEELVPADDPAAWAKIEEARAIAAQIKALEEDLNAAVKAIPRLSIEAIPNLIKASEHRFEEGAPPPSK